MKVDILNTDKKYNVIYADPPWQYRDRNCNGACQSHYNTMTIQEICNLPIEDICEKDCILFLWATYPMLQEAMQLIKAWGFKYKTIGFQWVKKSKSGNGYFFGLGRWTRGNTEPCLIAVRGKPYKMVKSKSVGQLIVEPLQAHSKKPDVARDKISELLGGEMLKALSYLQENMRKVGIAGGTKYESDNEIPRK